MALCSMIIISVNNLWSAIFIRPAGAVFARALRWPPAGRALCTRVRNIINTASAADKVERRETHSRLCLAYKRAAHVFGAELQTHFHNWSWLMSSFGSSSVTKCCSGALWRRFFEFGDAVVPTPRGQFVSSEVEIKKVPDAPLLNCASTVHFQSEQQFIFPWILSGGLLLRCKFERVWCWKLLLSLKRKNALSH